MIAQWQQTVVSWLDQLSDSISIQIVVVLVIAALAAKLADTLFLKWLKGRVAKVDKDNPLVATRRGPLFYSLLLLGLAISATLLDLSDKVGSIFTSVLMTLAILVWARFVLRISRFFLRSMAGNDDKVQVLNSKSLPLFENTAFIFIIAITLYYVFINWNVDMTAWLASAGIVGIAVGFAAKDTLANLFSGIFIMADAPYKIGDMVVIDSGERGAITKIGIRSTRMVTRDDIEVTIPNAVMGNSKIVNESSGKHHKSRIRVQVGVAYGSDIDFVEKVLMEIGEANEYACADPAPRVRFRTFGPSALNFELLCWIEDPALRGRVLNSLNGTVYKRFMKEGIEIAYNSQDIYIKEMPPR